MGTPRGRPLIRGVNNDATFSLISGLSRRDGIRRLLQALGFTRPLREAAPPAGIRTLRTTSRSTLRAFVATSRRQVDGATARALARQLRADDAVSHHVLVVSDAGRKRVALVVSAPGEAPRHVLLEPATVRSADVELVRELVAAAADMDTAAALRMLRALDRSRVGDRFFRDIVAVRDRVARHWSGVPRGATDVRQGLALLLLSRLMFLYFLQRRGVLDGDQNFLPRLLAEWRDRQRPRSFFRGPLRTLFFGVLNRRPAQRTRLALGMGELPYLNGGLFEMHRLERACPELDIDDEVMLRVFSDLLEKYRFTSSDAAEQEADASLGADVDPEMLGRIFEGLMPGDRRVRTGTFYTPAAMVDRVVCAALSSHLARRCGVDEAVADAVVAGVGDVAIPDDVRAAVASAAASLRILDPACGSGAFLLGGLARLARLQADSVDELAAARRDVVAHALHGVDLLEDAALICSLRLWLALVPGNTHDVPPLPNLDRRIRQGDALVDPLDLGIAVTGRPLDTTAPPELRPLLASIAPASAAYLRAGPEEKPALRRELESSERKLARAWLASLSARLDWQVRELAARAGDTNLFGEPAPHAATAQRQLASATRRFDELRAFTDDIGGARRLPFFSFRVHFAEAGNGFDLVISNPPWVRAHGWPPTVRRLLRDRFQVCTRAGWPGATEGGPGAAGAGAQVDLSLLFLERSLRLLNDRGTLAMLLPAKLLRSLYAGGARELVLQSTHPVSIEDHSLDHRSVFDADAFTCVLVAHRRASDEAPAPSHGASVNVTLKRAGEEDWKFSVDATELPLVRGDLRSPWLLVPPGCREVLRAMQAGGTSVARECTVRRGVMTGANHVMLVQDVEPKLGDMARIRTEGYHRAAAKQGRAAHTAWVEGSALRPALRGTDVAAWRATPVRHLLWAPCNDHAAAEPLPRLQRFLHRHRGRLHRPGAPLGSLQRLSPATLGHKVVWSDLASDLRAAAVPDSMRGVMGLQVPVVPLNTVYFIATSSAEESMLLAAFMNSLPLRLFARSIAERAKDAHFRFFAWTVGVLPLPRDWRTNACAPRLAAISRTAHARGACLPVERDELDRLVARAFGLSDAQFAELVRFDDWLRNTSHKESAHARAAG